MQPTRNQKLAHQIYKGDYEDLNDDRKKIIDMMVKEEKKFGKLTPSSKTAHSH